MKYAVAALLGLVAAEEITYSADLKCGKCIKGGFIYCVENEGEVVADGETEGGASCNEDDTAADVVDGVYTCSNTFSDTEYALTICPQKQNKCGSNQDIELADVDATEDVEVAGLAEGESCTFKVKTTCGTPAFSTTDSSTTNTEKFEISYMEFDGAEVDEAAVEAGEEGAPAEGMPPRNQDFSDSGDQGSYGGQKRPPKKNEDGEDVDQGEFGEGKRPRPTTDEDTEEEETGFFGRPKGPKPDELAEDDEETTEEVDYGTAEEGYGKPTKGTYDASEGGYKTFGSVGQGESTEGLVEDDAEVCQERNMYITVTANEDLADSTDGSDTILLEVGSYSFQEIVNEEAEESSVALKAGLATLSLAAAMMA